MQAMQHSLAATEEEIEEIVVDKPSDSDEDKESEADESDSVRGRLRSPIPLAEYVHLDIPDTLHLSNSPYIPPHQQQIPFPSDSSVHISVHSNSET